MAGLLTVEFAHVNGLPEDNPTNSFALSGTVADLNGNAGAIFTAFENFYNQTQTAPLFAVGTKIAGTMSRVTDAGTMRLYDISDNLDGSPHGSPIQESPWTLVAADGQSAMPDEVATVLRLHATGRSVAPVEAPDGVDANTLIDRPKQRRTGRVYLGPLSEGVHDGAPSASPRPNANWRNSVVASAQRLDDELRAIPVASIALAVWSRVDAAIRALEAVSMDDAFDTQRSRGVAPTVNTQLAVGA